MKIGGVNRLGVRYAGLSSENTLMTCQEKLELLDDYDSDVKEYSASVIKLRELASAIPHEEYMLLWEFADRLRKRCQGAQRAVRMHVAEHGC